MLWNVTSVLNKNPEFQKFLHDQYIDIAITTETWLSSRTSFSFQNFHINRKDRTNNRDKHPSAGVLIAVNNRIPIEDHPQSTSSVVETTAVKVKAASSLIIMAAYVPPKHRITPEELDQITYKTSHNMYIIEATSTPNITCGTVQTETKTDSHSKTTWKQPNTESFTRPPTPTDNQIATHQTWTYS